MVFTSFAFAAFLAVTLFIIGFLPTRGRVYALIVASYLFYSVTYPPWVLLLAVVSVVDYWLARAIERERTAQLRRGLLAASCTLNLGLLAFYKYAAFLAVTINSGLGASGVAARLPLPSVGLPLGISFFVFESLSYVIDVYRGRFAAIRRFDDYALFIAFFPHLVAGPIVRARDFVPQIEEHQPFQSVRTMRGVELVAQGYFKKTVIADNLAPVVDTVYASASAGGAALWLATFGFAVQIYCDFSGYTDIARGLAKVMGFELGLNFNFPYLSRSIRDFWRRWHMSLSAWLRDYVYVPIGGSRHGVARTALALTATWFLGGLWHGAAWHFVVWGLYHGVLVSAAAVARGRAAESVWDRLPATVQVAVTFTLVLFGWVLFRARTLDQAWEIWRRMLGLDAHPFLSGVEPFTPIVLIGLVLITGAHVFVYRVRADAHDLPALAGVPYPLRVSALAAAGIACFALAAKSQAFIYFQF